MKVSTISQTNAKGQVVIPKEVRDSLGITPQTPLNIVLRGEGVYLYPVKEILTSEKGAFPYLKILEKTQGSWKGDSWLKTEKKRKEIEAKASTRRKREW